MLKEDSCLTTYDNPFNPFTDFEIWWKTDMQLGHDCCGTLARMSNVSDVASDAINDKAIYDAMTEIVRDNPMIYKIVTISDYQKKL